MVIAEVIPEKRTGKNEFYSYLVPDELKGQIKVGSIVEVPFGKKKIRGLVSLLDLTGQSPTEYKLKELANIKDGFSIPPAYIKVARWISGYYLCSLGEAISLFLPPALIRARKIEICDQIRIAASKQLSKEQEKIFEDLKLQLDKPNKKPALILGVTSSGKTEIYLKLAEEVLKQGKQVIVLVPEIILTPQSVERFEAVFGDKVALMHSELSKSERLKSYEDFFTGRKPIIIGPRSALLVPSERIGLIIIDEEEDNSYKQEKNPKYSAIRLAGEIAKELNAQLVLGSATPTVESFYLAEKNEYDLHELKSRYQRNVMPPAEIVDLKQELKSGNFSPVSAKLQEAIYETLNKKRHIFLFLNRRGAATFVSCRECGEVILCPNCSIPLVYHLPLNPSPFQGGARGDYQKPGDHFLNCHHCDYTTKVPYSCPTCGGYKIKYFGSGVEKIEKEIKKLFPTARVRRIDSGNMATRDDYRKLYNDLKDGQIDILIGTQMIAKGLDIPTVDLVGVISADIGLHLPYYKADERVFQILTQVSGRSGRGEVQGRTIIQTYWPESRAILAAKDHNYRLFYKQEVLNRKQFLDPPFLHLIRVISENNNRDKANEAIREIARKADKCGLNYTGPAKAFFSRLRGKYRYHLIFKVKELPNKELTEVFKANPYLFWDVDPENLL